ncbi:MULTISPECIES: hypothetical protein [unclassified Legionella]|uniref:hypothetical protein n=1 Tax=unclassified Legionella TaxID=2622702 RepID=UPI001056A444|nr:MULTISPECIES: hypothetical protein [unclassified Legionella]MDI9818260.1 hypothetical protein [Legionella sp. PL877]
MDKVDGHLSLPLFALFKDQSDYLKAILFFIFCKSIIFELVLKEGGKGGEPNEGAIKSARGRFGLYV